MSRRIATFSLAVLALYHFGYLDMAQAALPVSKRVARKLSTGQGKLKRKKLAPGVLTVIQPKREESDTFSGPHPLVEILGGTKSKLPPWQPLGKPHTTASSQTLEALAKRVIFRRTAWHLEFAFKPLRMISVDIPQPNRKIQRKLVWYMVYRIKNNGKHLRPTPEEDKFGHRTFETKPVDHPVRFFPRIVLKSHEFDKEYSGQIIPIAMPLIQNREDPAIRLRNSVEIGQMNIPVSDERTDRSVWGVVTWTDIDPHIDFFSIYVQGLTNSYRWEDVPGAYKEGDPPGTGRRYFSKTLQLNFWRPGDAVFEEEKEIHYGIPLITDSHEQKRVLDFYDLKQRVDHLWVYR